MKLKNKKTGKVFIPRSKAIVMRKVLQYLLANENQMGTGDIARALKKNPSSVLGACKRLEDIGLIDGYKGSGNIVCNHATYGVLTREKIEEIRKNLEKEGFSETDIETKIAELFEEADYWGSPPEWKWQVRKEWELT